MATPKTPPQTTATPIYIRQKLPATACLIFQRSTGRLLFTLRVVTDQYKQTLPQETLLLTMDPEILINSPESDEDLFDIGYPPSSGQQTDPSQASERSRVCSAFSAPHTSRYRSRSSSPNLQLQTGPRLCLLRQRGQTARAASGTASSNLPTTGSLPHSQLPATRSGALDAPQQSPNALNAPQQSPNTLDAPQRGPNALNATQQSPNALDAPQQSPNALDAPQQSPNALDAPQQIPNYGGGQSFDSNVS